MRWRRSIDGDKKPAVVRYGSLASLGGAPDGNNAARQDAWPKSIDFLDAVLHPD
jgi:hypothetical protein